MSAASWQRRVAPYARASLPKALWQLANTLVPFAASWAVAYRLGETSRLASLGCCAVATGFLLRIYIIQHDCGHGSFLPSANANHVLGSILGVVTLLPYFRWRYDHAIHHRTSSNLARRGTGDVWTMTVREYRAASRFERLKYRLYRSPLVLFGLGPFVLFVVWQRFPDWTRTRRERWSVYGTNVALAAVVAVAGHQLGWARFFAVEGPITIMGSTIAVWLFYVQHQFEGTYWAAPPEWRFTKSALEGASWYRLPRLLQWFTGNIGLHHVHHLAPKIPNYELERCLRSDPALRSVPAVTLWRGFRAVSLKLWDEDAKRLVTWREAHARPVDAQRPKDVPRGS